jgi:hypothetical protein
MRPGLFGVQAIGGVGGSAVLRGVALATLAGGVRAKIVAAVIRRPKIETAAPAHCARAYRNSFQETRKFVERFHDRTMDREFRFGPASEPVDPDPRADPVRELRSARPRTRRPAPDARHSSGGRDHRSGGGRAGDRGGYYRKPTKPI